jgi:hypothetical protein
MSPTLKDIEKLLDDKLTPLHKTLKSIDDRLSRIEKWVPVENTHAVPEIKKREHSNMKSSRTSL